MKLEGVISLELKKVTEMYTKDRALPLSLFVSIRRDYTVTFSLVALISPFFIILQDLIGILADTLLFRGQLSE